MKHVLGFIMNQMSANKTGIRKHRKAAKITQMNKFEQLEDLIA